MEAMKQVNVISRGHGIKFRQKTSDAGDLAALGTTVHGSHGVSFQVTQFASLSRSRETQTNWYPFIKEPGNTANLRTWFRDRWGPGNVAAKESTHRGILVEPIILEEMAT